ncbi:MAG: bifunctional diaminohydroxyphosphoribosylaminopyrimidine deaminase/5-amino-6-(5-phosphoribosylamino)uracil reductase RibD [Xanthomonadales bacterium]|nr:bifunctional diaminohydroxyphosphoribosylaminopyrimidine deaminase/5-amino-6-(5-phosphoribosylamino)uracil reductase RibD [Xanthomonadales bacterium]ODU93464.1 MAG: riboflavin biosynthesis protein RibD [Rhodanobacter sp. SCN 66-43]OJY83468.1 MAG: riboflavin biosynthesis protein RibD [Xanthomonadales bacterium 66-474]
MARALRLAERGLSTTQPNPRVGCVIERDGEIIGEGWHQRAGEPHAEVFALRAAGERARGATAYVTLEPCSHHGRTPPCADALIEAGIVRVVTASEDPNPKVVGAGLGRLRDAGMAVEQGLMRDAARELNRGFFSRFERGRPWVRVKLAMSLDGRTALANGESKWITGEAARADVQRWRARSSAILTGAGTARVDDPRLTVRLPRLEPLSHRERRRVAPSAQCWGEGSTGDNTTTEPSPGPSGHHGAVGHGPRPYREGEGKSFKPLRVVLDARLDALPPGAHLLDSSAPTLALHSPDAKPVDDHYARVELAAAECDAKGRFDLDAVLKLLAARGVNELQVEAGPTLCGALLDADLVDELLLYVAPVLLGDSARPLLGLPPLASMADRRDWRVVDRRAIGQDQRLLLRP